VSSIPSARRRSRFRPVRDGVAIGAYLTGQALIRWGREITASARPGEVPWPGGDGPAPRRRTRAALATVTTPVLLGAAIMQAGLGWMGVDLVTPLVRRLYSCDRLTHSATAGPRAPAPGPDVEASFAAPRASRR
jgi:hypothetical protein